MSRIARLLVANRGEIARRVMRSASAMGISTVAVYSEGDRSAPFVAEADAAFALGGRSAADSYLSSGRLLEAAERTGSDAVHPGYGFLSESAEFAEAVIDAGLIWVGPPPRVIRVMGDKLEAKKLMSAAGVPTLDADPGSLSLPVIVKAAGGGGGKGMRVVERAEKLEDALAAARREAESAFGNGKVFLEPYLHGARHVEVQVLGDRHGNVVHCFERECSVQRRHQKIIEESPSPALDSALREEMGRVAVTAARAVGYESAGTVEFLLDAAGRYFFLEMNTRIQVEHPVTEAVTGLDLVREQLRVALGLPLGFAQKDVGLTGHAIEARLYAEDPAHDFLPATGRLEAFEAPLWPRVRVDSGVEQGSEVSIEFDPMLAKVIAHAPKREEAALSLALALDRFRIAGLVTNRDYLVAVLRSEPFLAGDTTTDFADRVLLERRRAPSERQVADAAVASALWAAARRRAGAPVLGGLPPGWRNSAMPPERVGFEHSEVGEVLVEYRARRDGSFLVRAGGEELSVVVVATSGDSIDLEMGERRLTWRLTVAGRRYFAVHAGLEIELAELSRFPEAVAADDVAGGLAAPMPGKVTAVPAELGATVEEGQLLVVVEAMKMEHRIVAPRRGVVTEVRVCAGAQVESGDILVIVETEAGRG